MCCQKMARMATECETPTEESDMTMMRNILHIRRSNIFSSPPFSKMSLSYPLSEAHYCSLPAQSNVYGLSHVPTTCGSNKLLVASLQGNVLAVEFQRTQPSSREVHFTYIPGDAQIVSIDAFTKTRGSSLVVGITIIKPTEEKSCQYLNIYSEGDTGCELDLDTFAEACNNNIELSYIPYQLYHTDLIGSDGKETVFLLSGSDSKVHMFRECGDRLYTSESDVYRRHIPMYKDCPRAESVIWIDCVHQEEDCGKRVTALGCQNGTVRITMVDTNTTEILKKCEVQHDSAIASVKLFSLFTEVDMPTFVTQVFEGDESVEEKTSSPLHLLVVSTLQLAVVYRNVLENGFSEPMVLADSDRYDCAVCCLVADIDFDGQNEILLGTYGQKLLVYKFHPRIAATGKAPKVSQDVSSSSEVEEEIKNIATSSPKADSPAPKGKSNIYLLSKSSSLIQGDFHLSWSRNFAAPLLALKEIDISGDSVKEIIVLSLKGIHILQHDMKLVSELCQKRLEQAVRMPGLRQDVFQQLLAEKLS